MLEETEETEVRGTAIGWPLLPSARGTKEITPLLVGLVKLLDSLE
jgi:hypothetical protein